MDVDIQTRPLDSLDLPRVDGEVERSGDYGGFDASGCEKFGHLYSRYHVAMSHEWQEEDVKPVKFTIHGNFHGERSKIGKMIGGERWTWFSFFRVFLKIAKCSDSFMAMLVLVS